MPPKTRKQHGTGGYYHSSSLQSQARHRPLCINHNTCGNCCTGDTLDYCCLACRHTSAKSHCPTCQHAKQTLQRTLSNPPGSRSGQPMGQQITVSDWPSGTDSVSVYESIQQYQRSMRLAFYTQSTFRQFILEDREQNEAHNASHPKKCKNCQYRCTYFQDYCCTYCAYQPGFHSRGCSQTMMPDTRDIRSL